MLQRGDLVSHFEATTIEGEPFRYSTIWQRKNLLLVILPAASASTHAYVADLAAQLREFGSHDLACLVSEDQVMGISPPGVVVADKWGEVVFAAEASAVASLPTPHELIEWVNYVMNQCPECEGERR